MVVVHVIKWVVKNLVKVDDEAKIEVSRLWKRKNNTMASKKVRTPHINNISLISGMIHFFWKRRRKSIHSCPVMASN
jgi:hypothetical protein